LLSYYAIKNLSHKKYTDNFSRHALEMNHLMNDRQKTKSQLIDELNNLRKEINTRSGAVSIPKEAEEAMMLSERFTRSIIDSSIDMIIATDIDRRIVQFNHAAEETFGFSQNEVLGKQSEMLYADRNTAEQVNDAIKKKKSFTGEVLNKRKNGEIFPAYLSSSILRGADNAVLGIVNISRDIGMQKRSERELAEKELVYRTLFEGAHDAIFTMKEDRFIDCNLMTLSMFGCTQKEQIVNHHPWEFSPATQPDGRNSIESAGEKIAAALSGAPQRFYWKHRRLDGTPFDSEISLSRIELQNEVLILAIVRNITEQWQAREALNNSEKKYRSIVNNAPIGFYQSNLYGQFITVNETLAAILGYDSAGELWKKNIGTDIYYTKGDRERLIQEYQSVEIGKDIEVRWKKKDGSPIWVQLNIHTVHDAQGTVQYFDGFVRDITERKRTEDALRSSEERYRSLFDQMLDGMYRSTHDGRFVDINPAMASMFGYSSIEEMMKIDIKKDLYFAPEDRSSRSLEVGREQIEEYLMRRKDGSPIWVEDHGRYILDDAGNIQYHEGMLRDISDRKKAEKILKESEARFKAIFEHNPIMIFVVDGEGKVIEINAAAEVQMGYRRDELIGNSVLEVFFKEDRPIVLEQISYLLAKQNEQSHWKIRKVKKDGGIIWVNENAGLMQWTDGREVILITCEDITRQKENDDTLRKFEEENRAIVNAVPDLIFRLTRQGVFLDFRNPSQTPLLAPPEQFLGKHLAEVLPPSLASQTLEKIEEAFLSDYMISFEYDLELNGEHRHFEDRLVALDNDEVMSFVRDITERKRSEEALRQSEYWLKESQRVARIGSYNFNIAANSWIASPVLEEIFGIEPNFEKTLQSWNDLVHPDDREEMAHYFQHRVVGLKKPFNKEYRIVRKRDGVVRWVWGLGELQFNSDGNPVVMIGTIQDVTERNNLQHQLLQLEKVQSIGTLAGGIAHDFNNILAIILAYTSRIRRGKLDQEQMADSLTAVNNAVERGAALVRQILTFARKTDVSFAPVDLTDLIHELSSMLRETFPKTITIQEVFKAEIPNVNADKTQIHQALLNLCVNARDAMPNGGTITILVDSVPRAVVARQFLAADQETYVQIAISDTGMGMDNETKEKIFDPFFTTKEKGKGTGLGLSVVFGVLQTHGAFVDVESAVGAGTIFRVYFPALAKIAPSLNSSSAEQKEIPGGTETILLVEDEGMLLDIMQTHLRSKGYRVIPAMDGQQAVDLYRAHSSEIHLVLTDIGLPVLSGIEEFHKLKKINAGVKVIIASGFFEPDVRMTLSAAGAKGFIQKPYVINDILEKIREVLDENN
jgi:two-component system cell cycle sensor histidine kinase/response regulator CckA